MIVFITLFFWCILEVISGQDCSGNYETLPDLKLRTTNNNVQNGPYKSDNTLVNKWYNVGSNNMAIDSANLLFGSCGGLYPVWMQGAVPSISEGIVNRTACTVGNYYDCESPTIIQVKNCGTNMLYKLLPTAVSTRYCFDPMNPPIFLPDSATVQPGLLFSNETNTQTGEPYKMPKLQFRCDFKESKIDELFYSVSWKVNNVSLITNGPVLFSEIYTTNLYENQLNVSNTILDISIHCVVQSRFSISGHLSESTMSGRYWLGIRVVNPYILLPQNGTATVQLQPTFPVGCSSLVNIPNPRSKCSMQISMFDPYDRYDCTSNSISVKDSQKCGVSIPGFYYDEWTPGTSFGAVKEMTITSKNTLDYGPQRNRFELKLVTEGSELNGIVKKKYLTDITVVAIREPAWQGKWCYSYVDPHMKTFDGISYENQNLGTFIMYNHSSSKQEVQMQTKQCNWYATCACGVTVRAGGDLFTIDLCGSPRIIKHVSCKEGILDVRQETAYRYKIYMPLGTMVSVDINTGGWADSTLNIAIYPSVKDVYQTSGLCGVLDNSRNNDFTTRSKMTVSDNNVFSLSWRIDRTQSHFDSANQNPDLWNVNASFCVCPAALTTSTTPSTASGNNLNPLCSASVFLACANKVHLLGSAYSTCNIRTKRSKYSMSREIERILNSRKTQADTLEHHNHLEKRSTFQIAFNDAYEQCALFFAANCTTSLFENNLPNSNLNSKNNSITNCALDYTYIGDMSLANLHCEIFRSEVDAEIRRNSTFREVNPDVVNSFRATACINNCHNHGDCVNGTCICHVSYIENDCSVSLSDFPMVDDTYSGGLCQRDGDECCGQIPIYGSRFVKGITKQKVERFQIYINGTMVIKETIVKDLPILNLFEAEMNVTCETRKSRSINSDSSSTQFLTGTRVSLTNDGTNFGSAQTYYIYDSRCQGVSNDTNGYTFYLLNGTCFISDTCYIEGDQDPLDSCNRCLPYENFYSWTNNCTSTKNDPPTSTESSSVNNSTATSNSSNSNSTVNNNLSNNNSTFTNISSSNNAMNNNSSNNGSSGTHSLDNTIIIISVSVGAILAVSVISVIIIIKCCLKKQKRISGKLESNVATTIPGERKLDNRMLFCSQQSLRENGSNAEQEDTLHHENLWKYRPGTPGAISMNFK